MYHAHYISILLFIKLSRYLLGILEEYSLWIHSHENNNGMCMECYIAIVQFKEGCSDLTGIARKFFNTTREHASGLVWTGGTGYPLSITKEVLKTKILSWVKKITKKSDYVCQQNGALIRTEKAVQDGLDVNLSFWPRDYCLHSHQIWTTLTSACGRTLRKSHATAAQISSRLLWTAYGGKWGKSLTGKSTRAFDLD